MSIERERTHLVQSRGPEKSILLANDYLSPKTEKNLPRVLHSHKLAVGNETVVGLVAETGGVRVDVGALQRQVDERRVVRVLPVHVDL